jgi:D-alanine--poly(phosphoribitol) ligase subunit 2
MNGAVRTQVAGPPPPTRESDGFAERLGAIFIDHLHIDVPTPETDLLEAGFLDSLALVELLLQVEREFNIAVSLLDLDIEHVRSLRSLSSFLSSALTKAGAAR